MSNKQSPFNDINYEWTYGSDGWNIGMDENMVKLSFLSIKVVDSFEAVLPSLPVTEGRSCVLPDNTVHFYVNSTWFAITPTDGEIWVVAGKEYQIVGGVFSEVLQATTLEATITPKVDKLLDENKTLQLGNISGNTTVTLDGKGYVQAVVTGDTSFIFNDAPISGEFNSWYLELEMTGEYLVVFPATIWDGVTAPVVGSSGKYIFNFKTTPTNRFGSVEVGGSVLAESSQGVFIGGAVVVPSTNPTTSTSTSTPPDVITTENGQVFLKEGKVASIPLSPQGETIRDFAPWLEVSSYEYDFSAIKTVMVDGNNITVEILDRLWDDDLELWAVLTRDTQTQTGSVIDRRRIFTTPDMVNFTVTTALNSNNVTEVRYGTLLKFKDGVGVTQYGLTVTTGYSAGGLAQAESVFISPTLTATSWTPKVMFNAGTGALSNPRNCTMSRHGEPLLLRYQSSSTYRLQRWNAANNIVNVTTATTNNISSADFDGVSKYYYSTVAGIFDQTNTSIGISFLGANDSTTGTEACAPLLRYIPELSGWIAIEYNFSASRSTSTYQPKVYFRPDTTEVWGVIGDFPKTIKANESASVASSAPTRTIEVTFRNGIIYVVGLVDADETNEALAMWTHIAYSEDGGVTWTTSKISDKVMPSVSNTHSYMTRSSLKVDKDGEYFTIVKDNNSLRNIEYKFSTTSSDIFVETNQSSASPTVTTTYTRIV